MNLRPTDLLREFRQRGRIASWRARGVALPWSVQLENGIDFRRGMARGQRGDINVAPECQLSQGVVIHAYGGTVRLGRNVFLGPYVVIYGHGGIDIGEHTLVSMHCRILSSNHTVPGRNTLIRSQPDVLLPTKIGRDVWLGAGVTVLGGVTIGDGCVVGAGAVVTRDLPAGSIAMGVPASVVRPRE
jgi:acetyltransferase-like isoleucine patch superfamily enzyme